MLNYYYSVPKFDFGTHTICTIATDILKNKFEYDTEKSKDIQKLNGVTIYPSEFFCCKNISTGQIEVTNNSYCIHHYLGSWLPKDRKEEHELRERTINKAIEKYGKEKGIKLGKIFFWLKYFILHPIRAARSAKQRLKNFNKSIE